MPSEDDSQSGARSDSTSSGQAMDEGVDVGSDGNTQGTSSRPSKQHPCPNCGGYNPECSSLSVLTPISPSSLKTHMNTHTGDKFKCGFPGCDMAFAATSNARRHRRLHGDAFFRKYKPEKEIEFCNPVVHDVRDPLMDSPTRANGKGLKWMPAKVPKEHVSRKIDLKSGQASAGASRHVYMANLKG
uniref:C2H2-type domain-containing protein n=1 Tax=Schizophyllum commune (strain H4-8 / FGSC 9210) TaxID=578458 RepID=D8QEB1_SCHCM